MDAITEQEQTSATAITEHTEQVFAMLTSKQQAFVKAYAAAPWNQAQAERSSGYAPSAANRLLKNPSVIAAIQEEQGRLRANNIASCDVIRWAKAMVEQPEASDMARVRAMELVADILGCRNTHNEVQANASVIVSPAAPTRFADPTPSDRAQEAVRELAKAMGQVGPGEP